MAKDINGKNKDAEEKEHPFYKLPKNPNQKIWRYMDFTKFVSLLDSESLFFPRADLLGDPFEGSVSTESINRRIKMVDEIVESFKSMIPEWKNNPEFVSKKREELINMHMSFGQRYIWERLWTFINCWHINDNESAAMWKLYSKSNEAIAVQSTVERLDRCLEKHRNPVSGQPKLSMVYYKDYEKENVSEGYGLSTIFHKRDSFSHEKEIRAIIQELPLIPSSFDKDGNVTASVRDYEKEPIPGKKISIDLDDLIEKIYVAPTAPVWFKELTEKIVTKYGLASKEVIRSVLDKDPIY